MAESPLGGGHQYHSHEAGSPINCPSGCKLRHKPGTDLNQASCDCEEGYYDREQRVFYTGSEVRDKKSRETRQQYLERIEGTDADPKKNNQGDYFLPGDGIRYEVLRSMKEEIFGERAQIWKHELNGQPGWLIRADRRGHYAWPLTSSQDHHWTPPAAKSESGHSRSSETTSRSTASHLSSWTVWDQADLRLPCRPDDYKVRNAISAAGPSYTQVDETFDLAGIGSVFPANPQGNLHAPGMTPQSNAPSSEARSHAISRQSTAQPGQDWQAEAQDIQDFSQRLDDDIKVLQLLLQAMLLSNLPQQESEQEFARRYSEQDYTPCEYHQRAIWNTQMEIANAARACHVQHRQPPCQIHRLPPIIFIDAQNKISHFHIENITTSPALKNSLECQFPDVGLVKVKRGEFAIRRRGELMDVDMSSPFHEWFVPGGEYNMSFVFDAEEERTATCPSCHARSDAAPGDETQW
ncbi:hypothetical protein AYO21_01188 [Fonsecaea monophora]|uniref:Uncharacterized protein n=1 Tax=Fonsecaea monophora TaxID=254056 RepID=A0A177FKA5_9EURO|nr:hypothetical protein AYO21_01188 [Fonsecaea monophora]OAG44698.1 hypothetical protein AYO21_01188 [Fonsecaea monophora]